MTKNQVPQYEVGFIKKLLVYLINEDKTQGNVKKAKKDDYLKNSLKACKKLNKQLDRPTFDR